MSSTRSSINSCHIMGRLGRDPEIRHTTSGAAVANFSVAVDDYDGKGQDGKSQYSTSWFDCVLWGEQQAQFAYDNYRKGDKVVVIGSHRQRKYTNKEGVEVKVWEVRVTDLVLADAAPESGDTEAAAAPAPVAARQPTPVAAPVAAPARATRGRGATIAPDIDTSDVPF